MLKHYLLFIFKHLKIIIIFSRSCQKCTNGPTYPSPCFPQWYHIFGISVAQCHSQQWDSGATHRVYLDLASYTHTRL